MTTKKPKNKILTLEDLTARVAELRSQGRKVVQSHGVFDVIHPGVVRHVALAKEQGDVLVVSIIRDRDVRKGPGRPIFPELLRAENVASLEMVDFVAVVDDAIPFESVGIIKPDVFARGQAWVERDRDIHDKITQSENELYLGKVKIFETTGFSFSSTQLINNFLDIYPEETKRYLKKLKERHPFREVQESFRTVQKLKVLLIGDGIVDEYHYCSPMGKSAKTNLVVSRYLSHEVFAGGVFAIANHLAGICDDVHLVTLLGLQDSREEFVNNNLKPNISHHYFYRDDGPTIVKKRYLDRYHNQKLFEVNFLNDRYLEEEAERQVIDYLKAVIPEYDLVLVSDFGHGFITRQMIRTVEKLSRLTAVNTQTNAANSGYNMITKYRRPFFICLDELELRWAAQERFADIGEVIRRIQKTTGAEHIITTLGKQGCIGIRGENTLRSPIVSTKVVDTVGAGDAFFSFTAPCLAAGMPLDLVLFVGNAVGALAVQIIGNKKPVEKYELLEFVHSLLK
jgi:bifunctional ADP-heptose synthase (sugar kinase/adenylyltransferase)